MTSPRWVAVGVAESLAVGKGHEVTPDGESIAIFNLGPSTELGTGNRFLAVGATCPHQGGPLADGIVSGDTVVCPLHRWKVNLTSGCVERPGHLKACVPTYETRVENGVVLVALPRE